MVAPMAEMMAARTVAPMVERTAGSLVELMVAYWAGKWVVCLVASRDMRSVGWSAARTAAGWAET